MRYLSLTFYKDKNAQKIYNNEIVNKNDINNVCLV